LERLLLAVHGWVTRNFVGHYPRNLRIELEDGRPIELPVLFAVAAPTDDESPPAADRPEALHSPDFRSVNWFGRPYRFSELQAACVRALWEAWEQGTPELSQQTILEAAESDQTRLDHVFRNRGRQPHPAFGSMIVSTGQGVYRLQPPPA
jgi:hypothetical protein